MDSVARGKTKSAKGRNGLLFSISPFKKKNLDYNYKMPHSWGGSFHVNQSCRDSSSGRLPTQVILIVTSSH